VGDGQMKNIMTGAVAAVGVVFALLIRASIGGIFIWLLWPGVISYFLPGAVAAGVLPATVGLWKSILLSWFCAVLFNSGGSK